MVTDTQTDKQADYCNPAVHEQRVINVTVFYVIGILVVLL